MESVDNVKQILKFCKKQGKLAEHLQGLPLLLRADGYLDVFGGIPVFASEFSWLLSGSLDTFLHKDILAVLSDLLSDAQAYLNGLDLASFSSLLPNTLDSSEWQSDARSWDPLREGVGGEEWMRGLWKYLQEQTKEMNRAQDRHDRQSTLLQVFAPVMHWSIVPALSTNRQPVLYTLRSAWRVIYCPPVIFGGNSAVNGVL